MTVKDFINRLYEFDQGMEIYVKNHMTGSLLPPDLISVEYIEDDKSGYSHRKYRREIDGIGTRKVGILIY